MILALLLFAQTTFAETFDCYYPKSKERFGVIVIKDELADLKFWGPNQSEHKDLLVTREGRTISIEYPYYYYDEDYEEEDFMYVPIILKKRRLARGFKYYFVNENLKPFRCYQTQ